MRRPRRKRGEGSVAGDRRWASKAGRLIGYTLYPLIQSHRYAFTPGQRMAIEVRVGGPEEPELDVMRIDLIDD